MSQATQPVPVFWSYAHEDEWCRDELGKHLAPLRQAELIDDWHDRGIRAGDDWEESIAEKLESARMFLFLVSSDFLASDYITGREMPRALDRKDAGHAVIIPVIVRPCRWQESEIAKRKLQVVPRNAKPVTKWDNIDEALENVAEGVTETVRSLAPSAGGLKDLAAELARLWTVPRGRNRFFTGREDELEAIEAGLAKATPIVLYGGRGTGKTEIAVEFAHRNRKRYDLVSWIRAEETDTALADFAALAETLKLPEAESDEHHARLAAVRRWLAKNEKWLVLLDNVTNQEALARLLPPEGKGHVIATSRSARWDGSVEVVGVGPWGRGDSVAYLLARTGEDDSESADKIADYYGDLPLDLEQAAALIEQRKAKVS
ncbi:MAG: TIR domain-containing protein [Thermoanaerobaculia bacterium]